MNFLVKVLFILVIFVLCQTSFAQEAIFKLEADDTLPIASQRFDDAVEPPKNNFSSTNGNDDWEKFERGDLSDKAYVELQKRYQELVAKNPELSKKFAAQKAKAVQKRTLASKGSASEGSKKKSQRKPQSLPKKLPAKKK